MGASADVFWQTVNELTHSLAPLVRTMSFLPLGRHRQKATRRWWQSLCLSSGCVCTDSGGLCRHVQIGRTVPARRQIVYVDVYCIELDSTLLSQTDEHIRLTRPGTTIRSGPVLYLSAAITVCSYVCRHRRTQTNSGVVLMSSAGSSS